LFGGIIALIFLLGILLLLPPVQTYLAGIATTSLKKDTGVDIHLEKIAINIFGGVKIKEILIKDHHQDTLIAVGQLKTNLLDLKRWMDGKMIFGPIEANRLFLNIIQYPNEKDSSLDQFVAVFDDGKPGSGKFLLTSDQLKIINSRFAMTDLNTENPKDVDFRYLNALVKDFTVKGPNVHGYIAQLSMKDYRGLDITKMQTDFDYTKTHITLKDLQLQTSRSNIQGQVSLLYQREDFQDFNNKVLFEIQLANSNVNSNDIRFFYEDLGADLDFQLKGNLTGTLNRFDLVDISLVQGSQLKLLGDLTFENLFDRKKNTYQIKAKLKQLQSDYGSLTQLIPSILGKSLPVELKKFGVMSVSGNVALNYQTLTTDVVVESALGYVESDLVFTGVSDIENASYQGNLKANNFHLGKLINEPMVQSVSVDAFFDGKGFNPETVNTIISGKVDLFEFNNYPYQNISLNGKLKKPIFQGVFHVNDPNLFMDFDGLIDISKKENAYQFEAKIDYADLVATKWIQSDSVGIFKGYVKSDLIGNSIDNLHGLVDIQGMSYQNSKKVYVFHEWFLTSSFDENKVRTILFDSDDFIQGRIVGKYSFQQIGKMVENALGSMYTNYKPNPLKQDQYVGFNLNIHSNAVEIFYPQIELGQSTTLRGRIQSNENTFRLDFKTPSLQVDDLQLHKIHLQIDNKNPLYNAYVSVDSLKTKFYDLHDINILNVTEKDSLFVRTEFKGGKKAKDNYVLNLYHTINQKNENVVGFRDSEIALRDFIWKINPNNDDKHRVIFDKKLKRFYFDQIQLVHDEQAISLVGPLEENNKDLQLYFKEVTLQNILPEIDDFSMKGIVNGALKIKQKEGIYQPYSDIQINDLNVNDISFGTLKSNIQGNESLNQFEVEAILTRSGQENFKLNGNIITSKTNPSWDLDLEMNEFNIGAFKTLGAEVISNIRGLVSGTANISGNWEQPEINGRLFLNQAGLKIPYLNVDYEFTENSVVDITQRQFIFRNIEMKDTKYQTKGFLNGAIQHRNFSNWNLDFGIRSNNLLALDTELTDESLYYGIAYIDGSARISGPINSLLITVDAKSEKGTHIRIPINNNQSVGENSFMYFLSPQEKYQTEISKNLGVNVGGLELKFDLDINENALIEVILDTESGHGMKGKGRGTVLMEINTNGKFNMWGDYQVYEGTYDYIYRGIFNKRFYVKRYGSIIWDGDPMKAQLDLKAIYKAQVNPSLLLQGAAPSNRRLPVEVGIVLNGNLENPNPDFTIDFPTATSILRSEIETQLADKDTRNQQAIYLLATGSFYNANNGLLNQDAVYNNLFESASSVFGNLFNNNDSKVSFNVGYNPGNRFADVQQDATVNFGTSFNLSDRVSVNGQFGVPVGGQNETSIVGNVELLYRVNDDGSLNLRVFNRENDINFIGEGIGFTQGIGLTYQVDFNNFRELRKKFLKKTTVSTNTNSNSELPDSSFPTEFDAFRNEDKRKKTPEKPKDTPPEID